MINIEQSNVLETKPTVATVGYRGIVKLILKKGDKVLQIKQYENHGLTALFDTICNALAGKSTFANLPGCVRLYSCTTENRAIYAPSILNENKTSWVDLITDSESANSENEVSGFKPILKPCSTNIQYSQEPAINLATSETNKVSNIVFQFKVPMDMILPNDDREKQICAIALMPRNFAEKGDKALAYYLLANGGYWDPLNLTTASNDFSLYIEWSMTFSNK